MPYVYPNARQLEGTDKVGSKQCVALVQVYAGAPLTAGWREGRQVIGDASIAVGTAIATFVGGRYESRRTGNHAGLYLGQDRDGLWIMDQWADDNRKPRVSRRYLRRRGTSSGGGYRDPSNNADAYAVID